MKKKNKKKKILEPPCMWGPKLLYGSIGTYRKTKKWKFWLCIDYGQMCSNKPQKNPYDIEIILNWHSQLWTP